MFAALPFLSLSNLSANSEIELKKSVQSIDFNEQMSLALSGSKGPASVLSEVDGLSEGGSQGPAPAVDGGDGGDVLPVAGSALPATGLFAGRLNQGPEPAPALKTASEGLATGSLSPMTSIRTFDLSSVGMGGASPSLLSTAYPGDNSRGAAVLPTTMGDDRANTAEFLPPFAIRPLTAALAQSQLAADGEPSLNREQLLTQASSISSAFSAANHSPSQVLPITGAAVLGAQNAKFFSEPVGSAVRQPALSVPEPMAMHLAANPLIGERTFSSWASAASQPGQSALPSTSPSAANSVATNALYSDDIGSRLQTIAGQLRAQLVSVSSSVGQTEYGANLSGRIALKSEPVQFVDSLRQLVQGTKLNELVTGSGPVPVVPRPVSESPLDTRSLPVATVAGRRGTSSPAALGDAAVRGTVSTGPLLASNTGQHASLTPLQESALVDDKQLLSSAAERGSGFRDALSPTGSGADQRAALPLSNFSPLGTTSSQHSTAVAPALASADNPASTPLSPNNAQLAENLGQRIQWMISSAAQRVDIRLDPPDLGSLQIQMSGDERQTSVTFLAQSSATRDLIEQHLPRLREHLDSLGIELADANVEQQSQQSGSEEPEEPLIAQARAALSDEEPTADANHAAIGQDSASGIDAYV